MPTGDWCIAIDGSGEFQRKGHSPIAVIATEQKSLRDSILDDAPLQYFLNRDLTDDVAPEHGGEDTSRRILPHEDSGD
jgi:hypothetical protein